jgi:branched-chain amino acid aminotransferase
MTLKFEIQPAANPTPEKERAARLADPGFGRIFTDHMAIVRYNQAKGWHDARVEARANFPLDPAAAVLHYAQEIFEGLKAYKRDNGVNLFRPDANARRFKDSADRMAMAPLPDAVFIEAVEQLVRIDSAWIPGGEGSLYLRPFMIASEVFLGVKPSAEYIFAVIASPVGSYFKGGPRRCRSGCRRTTRARGRRHRRRQMRRQLRREPARAGRGHRARLRSGGFPRRGRAPLRRGTRRHERVLRVRRRLALDAAARHDPAGHHPRFDHRAGKDAGTRVREEPYTIEQWRADAASGKLKEAFRLRHGGRHLADRQGVFRQRRFLISGRRGPAPSPWGCARSWSTSSTVAQPTRTTGSERSCDRRRSDFLSSPPCGRGCPKGG